MPCYYPLQAVRKPSGDVEVLGRAEHVRFVDGEPLKLPCGKCSGCRMRQTREKAMRCMHEKQLHKHNCYITLTINDQNLPPDRSLDHAMWQGLMRRLRKALGRKGGYSTSLLTTRTTQIGRYGATPHAPIKFYMCGEYGPRHGRPHYHGLLFGVDFADKQYWTTTPAGGKIYRSATLEKLWPYGYSSTADLTFQSAAYVARYVMKKRNDGKNFDTEEILDLETGEIAIRKREYNQISRGGRYGRGLASEWLAKYHDDVYANHGKVVVGNHQHNPPRYYDKLYKRINELQLEHIKYQRWLEAALHSEHRTPERLLVQEEVQAAKTRSLQRNATWET